MTGTHDTYFHLPSRRSSSAIRSLPIMATLAAVLLVGCDADGPSEQGLAAVDSAATKSTRSEDWSIRFHPESKSVRGYTRGPSLLLAEVSSNALDDREVQLELVVTPTATAELERRTEFGSGVVEVFVRPRAEHLGKRLLVELKAIGRDGVRAVDSAQIEVIPWGGNPPTDLADGLLKTFLVHLEAARPEMGLDSTTPWTESFDPYPRRLIVGHRAYLFDAWELKIGWHVTIAPHDWAYVLARPRNSFEPAIAFCLPSQTMDRTVQPASTGDPRCVN
ncbi:MAG: hypothetical protein H6729_07930 [Deltaproteobacteria bacterium]|nr:hypothetical protein [Deltaproteobacteria bacterium]